MYLAPPVLPIVLQYLEEEATATYTRAIQDLDAGRLEQWSHMDAPAIAKKYWRLSADANMRDLLLAIRADEVGRAYYAFRGLGLGLCWGWAGMG